MNLLKSNKIIIGIISILIFSISYGVLSVFFKNLNGEFISFIEKSIKNKVNPNIVVIEIDDLTLNKLGTPIERNDITKVLENLKKADTAVIGIDIAFLDEGKNHEYNKKLSKVFKELNNVISGFEIDNGKIILPYKLFENSLKGLGFFSQNKDLNTNKVYSVKPVLNLFYNNKSFLYEHFSLKVLREYYNNIFEKNDKIINYYIGSNHYDFLGKKIPLKNGDFYINFVDTENFKHESFYNIYTGNFIPDRLKDKIILIGYTASGIKDDFIVPGISNYGYIKGVYIHANIINNILNENYIIFFNKWIELIIVFLLIYCLVYFNIYYFKTLNLGKIIFYGLFLFLGIISFYYLIFSILYNNSGIYLIPNNPYEFISVFFLGLIVSYTLKYINNNNNKKILSQALSEYISQDIVKDIINSEGFIDLSGKKQKITIFFSDIEGFTEISEKITPEQLVKFLGKYIKEMSDIILDNKGFINKYEGDAILALWGVFGKVEKYGVLNALDAALLQQKKIAFLNKTLNRKINVRMGLNLGDAVVGNIGSVGRKVEFTALGDNVNLASRLEGVNKIYKTNICVSESVYLETKDYYIFRYLDTIKVKGKTQGIKIYELIGKKGEVSDEILKTIKIFEEGVGKYVKKDFKGALKIFNQINKEDKPSEVFIKRCNDYIKNPPLPDWDGIWNLNKK